MRRRPAGMIAAGVLVVSASSVLVGCAGAARPEAEPAASTDPSSSDPAVVWESQGTSELEQDPHVSALRAALTAEALARNAHDFSRDDFVATWGEEARDAIFTGARSQAELADPRMAAGPAVVQPLSVEPDGAGSVMVTVCDASQNWWLSDEHEPTVDLEAGNPLVYSLSDGDDAPVVQSVSGASGDCDATGAPLGRFDPAPEVPAEIDPDSLVRPPRD